MLGYVIALMVAWPIVGFIVGSSVIGYWFYKSRRYIDSSDAYIVYFNQVIAFDGNENNEIVRMVPKGEYWCEYVNSDSNKIDIPIIECINEFIFWPRDMRFVCERAKAAYEHFKSEV